MLGRRVGATTDGCVYSLTTRVPLDVYTSLAEGRIDGRHAFLAGSDAGLSGTVDEPGISNVFDVDFYAHSADIPEQYLPPSPFIAVRRGPAERRSLTPVPGRSTAPAMGRSFEELVAEAQAAPIEGWDFSWLDGRATEDRPSWGYAGLVAAWARGARADARPPVGRRGAVGRTPPAPPAAGGGRGLPAQRAGGRPRGSGPAGPGGGRPRRPALPPLCRRRLRPGHQPPSGHGVVGGDRPGPPTRRDLPLPAGGPAQRGRAQHLPASVLRGRVRSGTRPWPAPWPKPPG